MSRIAVISDIHGNLPALAAVMADLEEQVPDEVLVAGDLVGRGPGGRSVVERIVATGWPVLMGNHEELLLTVRDGRLPSNLEGTAMGAAVQWMAAELNDAAADFVRDLPFSLRATSAPAALLVVHGSPAGVSDGLGPWTSDALLEKHAATTDAEVLVCAHTHRPLDRTFDSGRVVNIGAVGLPFNRVPKAHYSIFTIGGERVEVERRVVEYDREAAVDLYRRSGFAEHSPVIAALLEREVRTARPHLVSFIEWTTQRRRPQDREALEDFLELRAQRDLEKVGSR